MVHLMLDYLGCPAGIGFDSCLHIGVLILYLDAFIPLAKQKIQEDLSFAIDLYDTVERYMVTDIDISEFTYLVTEALGYNFSATNLLTMPGETVMGEEFEEFYVDEKALQDMIMELFYEPVEKN